MELLIEASELLALNEAAVVNPNSALVVGAVPWTTAIAKAVLAWLGCPSVRDFFSAIGWLISVGMIVNIGGGPNTAPAWPTAIRSGSDVVAVIGCAVLAFVAWPTATFCTGELASKWALIRAADRAVL